MVKNSKTIQKKKKTRSIAKKKEVPLEKSREIPQVHKRTTRSSGRMHTVRGWLNYFAGMEDVMDGSLDGFRAYDHNVHLLSFADFLGGLCRCSAGKSMSEAITDSDKRKEFTDMKAQVLPKTNL